LVHDAPIRRGGLIRTLKLLIALKVGYRIIYKISYLSKGILPNIEQKVEECDATKMP